MAQLAAAIERSEQDARSALVERLQNEPKSEPEPEPGPEEQPRRLEPDDWFAELFGFAEGEHSYTAVQSAFAIDGRRLLCLENGRGFDLGDFTCPSLSELREAAGTADSAADLSVSHVATQDIGADHAAAENNGALIQAASQFNCLEMTSDRVTPDRGITGVGADATQGPACALATAPALLFRNYFVPIQGGKILRPLEDDEGDGGEAVPSLAAHGQTAELQLDNAGGMAELLRQWTGDDLWTMRNGYLRSDAPRLEKLQAILRDEGLREALKQQLRVGITWGAEVVCSGATPAQRVSQAWCSAVPAGSIGEKGEACRACTEKDWEPLARLVLEATYEATLLAGVINARRTGNARVLLCFVGGGVFGNRIEWIVDGINVGLRAIAERGLSCKVVVSHYKHVDAMVASAIGVDSPPVMKVAGEWTHNCGGGDLSLSTAISSCKWCGATQ